MQFKLCGGGARPGSVDYQSRYTVCLQRPDVCRITFSILLWSRVLEFVHRGAALQVFSSHLFVGVVLILFLCFSNANSFFCFNKTLLLLDLSKTHTHLTLERTKITEDIQKKRFLKLVVGLFLCFVFVCPPTNINCHLKAAWDVRLLASGSSDTHCFYSWTSVVWFSHESTHMKLVLSTQNCCSSVVMMLILAPILCDVTQTHHGQMLLFMLLLWDWLMTDLSYGFKNVLDNWSFFSCGTIRQTE